MSKKKRLSAVLATIAVALLLFACVLAPIWVFGMDDALLLEGVARRQTLASRLVDENDMYFIRVLHTRRRAAAEQEALQYSASNLSDAETSAMSEAVLQSLQQAGVFPQGLDTWLSAVQQADKSYTCQSDTEGVLLVQCIAKSGDTQYSYGYEYEPRTQKCIRFWATGAGIEAIEPAQTSQVLEGFAQYLGFGKVQDWAASESASGAYWDSQSLEAQLYCTAGSTLFVFGCSAI